MKGSKNKLIRYKNIFKRVDNLVDYFMMKISGSKSKFDFQIKDFGKIEVDKQMLGPFRENFFDEIYFRYIPKEIIENTPQPTIVDIGANVGFFSLAAFFKYPEAAIYSFEPHPYCYKVLSDYNESFKKYNWNLFNNAVSSEEGEIKLNTSTVSGFATMASVFDYGKYQEGFTAKTISLDAVVEAHKIETIDFMKMDCEGSEYSIIYGLSEDSMDKINSMCIETHEGKGDDQNIDMLNAFLNQNGFTTKALEDKGYTGYIWAWKSN